jgi:hypothetical protein
MTKLHERTFRTAPADVERDEALAVRCAALRFVAPAHLEIPPGLVDDDALARAAMELNRINAYKVCGAVWLRGSLAAACTCLSSLHGVKPRAERPLPLLTPHPRTCQAPRDKLVCILNCCRMINNLLSNRIQAEGIGE